MTHLTKLLLTVNKCVNDCVSSALAVNSIVSRRYSGHFLSIYSISHNTDQDEEITEDKQMNALE